MALAVNQAFLGKLKTMKLPELMLENELKGDEAITAKYREFLEQFKDLDLRTLLDVLELFPKIIDNALRKEAETRKVEDVKLPFINDERK